jgi:hypothetical protein
VICPPIIAIIPLSLRLSTAVHCVLCVVDVHVHNASQLSWLSPSQTNVALVSLQVSHEAFHFLPMDFTWVAEVLGQLSCRIRSFNHELRHKIFSDPCVFVKRDNSGATILIIVLLVDDSYLTGIADAITWFKLEVGKRFSYTEQGEVTKHLGIWYAWHFDENGDKYVVLTMPKLVD